MKIYGIYKDKKVSRIVFSKIQAYATINQMRRDGIIDINCDFSQLDQLP